MASITNNLAITNLAKVQAVISTACLAANRSNDEVQLLAVSKTRSADDIEKFASIGQLHFGENYLQEALDKQTALSHLPIIWHFIGPIQSNKTKLIAENFSWAHSVDRLKIARRLSEQRSSELQPLNVCLQVNISEEDTKAGCLPADCVPLMRQIAELPNLKLRGLMAIPQATTSVTEQEAAFAALKTLFVQAKEHLPDLDTLSMGMSADITPAIAQGSTIVRVGTALFGPRDYTK